MIVLLLLNNLLEWDRGTKIYTFASRKQARVVAHSRCSVKGGGITDAPPAWWDPFSGIHYVWFLLWSKLFLFRKFRCCWKGPGLCFLQLPFSSVSHYGLTDVLTLQLAVSKPGQCPLWATGLSRESERGRSVCRLCSSPSRTPECAIGCGSPSLSLSQSPFRLSSTASVSGLSTNPSRGQQSAAAWLSPETLQTKVTDS